MGHFLIVFPQVHHDLGILFELLNFRGQSLRRTSHLGFDLLALVADRLEQLAGLAVAHILDELDEFSLKLLGLFNRDQELLLLQKLFLDAQVEPMLGEPRHEVDPEAQLGHADDAVGDEVLLLIAQVVDARYHELRLFGLLRDQIVVAQEDLLF